MICLGVEGCRRSSSRSRSRSRVVVRRRIHRCSRAFLDTDTTGNE
jgi:hypothetical protein